MISSKRPIVVYIEQARIPDETTSIEFYANVKTADGREYKVPLSTANLTDGTLTSLLDSGGYPLTQNAQ